MNGSRGFTYISLLFIMTVSGIALAQAGTFWSTVMRREMEEELLFRGGEIRDAIGMYYESSPGAKSYPRNIEDLIKDTRYPVAKRYLRKIYPDPFTGKADWEMIKAADGGIMGVKSRSVKEPYKKKNFPASLKGFEEKSSYSQWEFVYFPIVKR